MRKYLNPAPLKNGDAYIRRLDTTTPGNGDGEGGDVNADNNERLAWSWMMMLNGFMDYLDMSAFSPKELRDKQFKTTVYMNQFDIEINSSLVDIINAGRNLHYVIDSYGEVNITIG